MPDPAVTALLDRARAGDADAFGRLVGELYGELRVIAHAQRRRLGAPDTVNTTAVVHEAYAKLGARGGAGGLADGQADGYAGGDGQAFADRAHFFRVAARAMRDVIVDYARAQRAAKRGGDGRALSLDAAGPLAAPGALDPTEVLTLDAALRDLERLDPESARVAELRYFAGLSVEETAEALDLSPATVKRRWAVTRAWLYRRLTEDGRAGTAPGGPGV